MDKRTQHLNDAERTELAQVERDRASRRQDNGGKKAKLSARVKAAEDRLIGALEASPIFTSRSSLENMARGVEFAMADRPQGVANQASARRAVAFAEQIKKAGVALNLFRKKDKAAPRGMEFADLVEFMETLSVDEYLTSGDFGDDVLKVKSARKEGWIGAGIGRAAGLGLAFAALAGIARFLDNGNDVVFHFIWTTAFSYIGAGLFAVATALIVAGAAVKGDPSAAIAPLAARKLTQQASDEDEWENLTSPSQELMHANNLWNLSDH